MKSSFSRSFFTAATILLLALSVLGASFQLQVNNFMEDSTVAGLQQDAAVISNLAAAYSLDGKLTSRELLLNLDVISQVTYMLRQVLYMVVTRKCLIAPTTRLTIL